MAAGTVTVFDGDEGWGAIASDALPVDAKAWVHFSAIDGEGYRRLEEGDVVEFEFEAAEQDGFAFRATWVRVIRSAAR